MSVHTGSVPSTGGRCTKHLLQNAFILVPLSWLSTKESLEPAAGSFYSSVFVTFSFQRIRIPRRWWEQPAQGHADFRVPNTDSLQPGAIDSERQPTLWRGESDCYCDVVARSCRTSGKFNYTVSRKCGKKQLRKRAGLHEFVRSRISLLLQQDTNFTWVNIFGIIRMPAALHGPNLSFYHFPRPGWGAKFSELSCNTIACIFAIQS